MTFLGTDVQRRATPKVLSVDVGSVGQKVLDDQVVVGGDSDVKGRLCPRGPGYSLHKGRDRKAKHAYLSFVLFQVQHAVFSHLQSQNVHEGTFALGDRDVENPASGGQRRLTSHKISK